MTRTNLTYKEKLSVLEAVEKGEHTKQEIAAMFSIGLPTLLRIIRTKDSVAQLGNAVGDRTRIRQPTYGEIEEALLIWLSEMHTEGVKVTAKMIKEKASEIAVQTQIYNFPASNGWLDNFRKRYGLSRTHEISPQVHARISTGEVVVSYEHEAVVNRTRKRKREQQPQQQKDEIEIVFETDEPTPTPSTRRKKTREIEIIDTREPEELEEIEFPYQPEEPLYTRADAMEAHQILVAYFRENPAPPGLFLSLQRIGEAIGDEPDAEAETEELMDGTIIVEEVTSYTDDHVSIEVEEIEDHEFLE